MVSLSSFLKRTLAQDVCGSGHRCPLSGPFAEKKEKKTIVPAACTEYTWSRNYGGDVLLRSRFGGDRRQVILTQSSSAAAARGSSDAFDQTGTPREGSRFSAPAPTAASTAVRRGSPLGGGKRVGYVSSPPGQWGRVAAQDSRLDSEGVQDKGLEWSMSRKLEETRNNRETSPELHLGPKRMGTNVFLVTTVFLTATTNFVSLCNANFSCNLRHFLREN